MFCQKIRAADLGILPGAGAQIKIYERSWSYGYLRGSSGSGSLPRY